LDSQWKSGSCRRHHSGNIGSDEIRNPGNVPYLPLRDAVPIRTPSDRSDPLEGLLENGRKAVAVMPDDLLFRKIKQMVIYGTAS
jgi:hypothetical protein